MICDGGTDVSGERPCIHDSVSSTDDPVNFTKFSLASGPDTYYDFEFVGKTDSDGNACGQGTWFGNENDGTTGITGSGYFWKGEPYGMLMLNFDDGTSLLVEYKIPFEDGVE